MTNHTEVIKRAIEATEMGFWDSAIHRLISAGWKVEMGPTTIESPRLGKFHATVTARTNGLLRTDDPECPQFGDAYGENFERALEGALREVLTELSR